MRIIEVKRSGLRRFVIVDAGMNDLIRPSLYDAHHELWPVKAACEVPRKIALTMSSTLASSTSSAGYSSST